MAAALKPAPLAERLATFIVNTDAAAIPASAAHEAKRALIGWLATAYAGAREPAYKDIRAVLGSSEALAEARLVGSTEKVAVLDATFLNAVAANLHDFDDTHIPTIIHPTAPIAAALLALGARQPIDGATFLASFALGLEVASRLGLALTPRHYERGWHITATCGVVGAAAAAAKALGLGEMAVSAALGSAATQACGLVECLGSSAKSLGVGNAARNGLFSALLAARGFEAPATTLDGKFGFLRVLSDAPEFDVALPSGDEPWQIQNNTHKPYPCGVVVIAVVDCCLKARENGLFKPGDIDHIVVFGNPLLGMRADRSDISSEQQAKVSLQHAAAVTLLEGVPGLEQFSDAYVQRRDVAKLRTRISFKAENRYSIEAAGMGIFTTGGEEIRVEVEHAYGSLRNPMTDADLETKLFKLSGRPANRMRALADAVWNAQNLADITTVLDLASLPEA